MKKAVVFTFKKATELKKEQIIFLLKTAFALLGSVILNEFTNFKIKIDCRR
jgi:hypothetical protein